MNVEYSTQPVTTVHTLLEQRQGETQASYVLLVAVVNVEYSTQPVTTVHTLLGQRQGETQASYVLLVAVVNVVVQHPARDYCPHSVGTCDMQSRT